MNTNYFNIKLLHKSYRIIITESRFYDVTDSQCNNDILDAVPVPTSTVAGLIAQEEGQRQEQQEQEQEKKKSRAKRKASRIRRLQKEVVNT